MTSSPEGEGGDKPNDDEWWHDDEKIWQRYLTLALSHLYPHCKTVNLFGFTKSPLHTRCMIHLGLNLGEVWGLFRSWTHFHWKQILDSATPWFELFQKIQTKTDTKQFYWISSPTQASMQWSKWTTHTRGHESKESWTSGNYLLNKYQNEIGVNFIRNLAPDMHDHNIDVLAKGDVEDVQISICWHNCCKKYVQSFILNFPHIAFRGHMGLLIPQRENFPEKYKLKEIMRATKFGKL